MPTKRRSVTNFSLSPTRCSRSRREKIPMTIRSGKSREKEEDWMYSSGLSATNGLRSDYQGEITGA